MASGLKEWADVRAPKQVSLEHEYMRGKATESSWKANDASIRANATSYHEGPRETASLHAEARNAHADAAQQWKKVGGEEGHGMAEKHEAAAGEHHEKHIAAGGDDHPRDDKGRFASK